MPKPRIPVSRKPDEALKLAAAVYAKHQALGANSPLNAVAEWAAVGPLIAPTLEHHDKAEAAARLAENEYELRDRDLPAIIDVVARSRNILANINSKNPRALGDWGYTVDDTPRPPKAPKGAKKAEDADPAP